MVSFVIEPIKESAENDRALEALLTESYVGGGYTAADAAAEQFRAEALRDRGALLVARDTDGVLLGSVIVVRADSPARRIAQPGEAEIHLLCVRPTLRGGGLGRSLVEAALARARSEGASRVVLWTQPSMLPAHRLYERLGFRREPAMDFARNERPFLVFSCDLGE